MAKFYETANGLYDLANAAGFEISFQAGGVYALYMNMPAGNSYIMAGGSKEAMQERLSALKAVLLDDEKKGLVAVGSGRELLFEGEEGFSADNIF